jgi:periplasmic protein TonB
MYLQQPMAFSAAPTRFLPGLLALFANTGVLYLFAVGLGVAPSPINPTKPFEYSDVPQKQNPVTTTGPHEPTDTINIDRRLPLIPVDEPELIVEANNPTNIPTTTITGGVVEPTAPALPLVQPRLTRHVEPTYPLVSRANDEEGTVQLQIYVGPNGGVLDARIERTSGFRRLDEAALKTVRAWRFTPAMRGTQAVATWVSVPVTFELHR